MNIVFFTHPSFFGSPSMVRFAQLLANGMQQKGHQVQVWAPIPAFAGFSQQPFLKKWLGYLDQYVVFPASMRRRLKTCPADTLFVFTDNALGPWVPLVAHRPHLVHCHDFLALRSALGQVPENPVSWTGRQYQEFIRRGVSRGRYFLSDSRKTQDDLALIIQSKPLYSGMEYIGLNAAFQPMLPAEARTKLSTNTGLRLEGGYLLHVGSEVWYKNRTGVIDIYDALRSRMTTQLPLVMIGQNAGPAFAERHARSPFRNDIHLLDSISDADVRLAYAGAELLLFPSLAEGFGWPIAEAMASGCPVITTDEAPMTEVAGDAGMFIPRRPTDEVDVRRWADEAASVVEKVLTFTPEERKSILEAGLINARRFDTTNYLDRIESIYRAVLTQTTDQQPLRSVV